MYSDKVTWKNFMKNIKFLCSMYICNGNGSLLEDNVGRFLTLKFYFQKFTVNHFMPLVPSENIRIPLVFSCFQGYRKGTVA